MPAEGGDIRSASPKGEYFPGNSIAWTADGRYLIAVRQIGNISQKSAKWEEILSVPTNQQPSMTPIGLPVQAEPSWVAMHPDGKQLAFTVAETKCELLSKKAH